MATERIYLDNVDSTNTYAKGLIPQKDSFVIIAKRQSAGRGRMGRSFLGEGGIYMSYATHSSLHLSELLSVTSACAVIVALALEKHSGKSLGIKWVNDIYLDGKKICGILTESVSMGADNSIIVGIGINIGGTTLPDELSDIAGCIDLPQSSKEALINDIISGLENFFEDPADRSYMKQYRERLLYRGKLAKASYGDKTLFGKILDVDDDGALLLMTDTDCEPVRIFSGEATLREYK